MAPSSRDSDHPGPLAAPESSQSADWFRLDSSSDSAGRHRAKAGVALDKPAWNAPEGYEVLGELGRGLRSVVYKARRIADQQLVALKLIETSRPGHDDVGQRFIEEASAAARVRHSHLIAVEQIGACDGHVFLVMEFADAGSLRHWLARTPPAAHQAAALLEPLARAAQAAHDHGLVHGQLQPNNILLCGKIRAEPAVLLGVTPKISDLGIARSSAVCEHRMQAGPAVYSLHYLAPEQAPGAGSAIRPAADVYSLGAILYEMLTGRPPFDGGSTSETLFLLRHHEPIPPRWFRPSIPKDIQTICLKCLEKQPRRRYARADELADDLQRFLNDKPIHARPPGVFKRCRRWCKWMRQ